MCAYDCEEGKQSDCSAHNSMLLSEQSVRVERLRRVARSSEACWLMDREGVSCDCCCESTKLRERRTSLLERIF